MPALFSFPYYPFFYRLVDKYKILSDYFNLRALICVIEFVFYVTLSEVIACGNFNFNNMENQCCCRAKSPSCSNFLPKIGFNMEDLAINLGVSRTAASKSMVRP